jgi:hypothetical protein
MLLSERTRRQGWLSGYCEGVMFNLFYVKVPFACGITVNYYPNSVWGVRHFTKEGARHAF